MTRRRQDNQKGATLVEAAMILPLLLFMVVSILELGVAFKDWLTTDFAAKEGARVGAVAGNDIDADCDLVQAIVKGYSAVDFSNLDHIAIFQVNTNGTPVGGTLNQWTFPNISGTDDPADCSNWAQSNPGGWPSVGRDVSVGPGSELDIIGVTVDTKHNWITGLPPWRGQMDIDRTAIQRLEPEAFE